MDSSRSRRAHPETGDCESPRVPTPGTWPPSRGKWRGRKGRRELLIFVSIRCKTEYPRLMFGDVCSINEGKTLVKTSISTL